MSNLTDPTYLERDQYHDASSLEARVRLHREYSTNAYGWSRWVFDQLDLPEKCQILELGCGPGYLWLENEDRIAADWRITLSDLSFGMVREARGNLRGSHQCRWFKVIDAQRLPYADGSLDAVIANHMLYHVPRRDRALAEIRRVLRPGGRLYAATNGKQHMRELREWIEKFHPQSIDTGWGDTSEEFGLETGKPQLERWFAEVQLKQYEDALVVTEAEPVIAYMQSFLADDAGDSRGLKRFLLDELATAGAIQITKESGLFEAVVGAGAR